MKTLGLIGGMSWESTLVYYQQLNRSVRERLGGLHSASLLLHSCDFAEIARLQQEGRWDLLALGLGQAARALERGGADCVAICTNTMHKVAKEVQAQVDIPLIDIRDATGRALQLAEVSVVGLLGTRYTMEQEFWGAYLAQKWGVTVLPPLEEQRHIVHEIIFAELCQGIVRPESRAELANVMEQLALHGAEAIILGCTELMLLVGPQDCRLPQFDTTLLHCRELVDFALS